MKKLIKVITIGLFAVWLSGCDDNSQNAAATQTTVNSAVKGGQASLLGGRFSFTVPSNLSDKGGETEGQTNNMLVYSDDSGRQSLVTLVVSADDTNLEVLAEALANQYHNREGNAKTVVKQAATIAGQPGWRLDIVSNVKGQPTYSSILMVIVGEELVTLQMSFPEEDSVKPETVVQQVMDSIVIK